MAGRVGVVADWKYLFADLSTNQIIDEIPMSQVRISKVLNGSGALTGVIKLGDAALVGRTIKEATQPARRVVYAIRDNSPFWGGIIWATSYDSDTRQLAIGATDWWSYFDHRRILSAITLPLNPYDIAGQSQIYTATDQNTIARALVTLAQSHTGGNIGIVADTTLSGKLRDRTYDGSALKPVGEALRDLANVIDGPDIVFDVGAFGTNGRPARIMRVGTPQLSQQGNPHTWDLGANLLKYTWSSGGGVMATRALITGAGQDRGTLVAVSEDTTLYATNWPLLEVDDAHVDVSDITTLQQYADSAVAGARLPAVSIGLSVRGDLTPALGSYSVGDNATFNVPALVVTNGAIERGDPFLPAGLNLTVRLTAINLSIDDNSGIEDIDLSTFPTLGVV